MINTRSIRGILKETFSEWQKNEVSLLASSLAYYTVFSLAPFMALVILLVGAIFDEATAKEQLVQRMGELFGDEGARLIGTAIDATRADVNQREPLQLTLTIAFLLAGATGFFAQIQNALNRIWGVRKTARRRVFHFLRKRLLTFLMVLAIALLLLISFFANSILIAVVDLLNQWVPNSGNLWQMFSWLVSLIVTTIIFILLYSILPDASIAWRDTLAGSIVTAILFLLGQFLFGLFLGQTNFGSAFGVAGSFAIVITWIFYAANILFLGATFTKVYAKHFGSPIVPGRRSIEVSRSRGKS